jgi:hypothetical protein
LSTQDLNLLKKDIEAGDAEKDKDTSASNAGSDLSALPAFYPPAEPHGSAYVFSATKGKHWFNVAPSLKETKSGRGEYIAIVLVMIIILLAGLATGFELQIHVLNPPAQVFGVCPPPAKIQGDNCNQVVTITVSSTTTTITRTAGYILVPNYGNYSAGSGGR